MAQDPFLLVSLEESESRELAKVISNKTSRKILDLLSKKDATESEIAKALKIPLSTAHYNLQHLLKANLVKADEYHYSPKGKEVNHYSLANKLIIIAPKKARTESFKDKLKKLFPISVITLAATGVVQAIYYFMSRSTAFVAKTGLRVAKSGADIVAESADGAQLLLAQAPPPNASADAVQVVQQGTNPALWFLLGAAFVILLLVIWYWFVTRKKKKHK